MDREGRGKGKGRGWIDGETEEGTKEGGVCLGGIITCVKCWRGCAHRNMFNGVCGCRGGARCVCCLFGAFSKQSGASWSHAGALLAVR